MPGTVLGTRDSETSEKCSYLVSGSWRNSDKHSFRDNEIEWVLLAMGDGNRKRRVISRKESQNPLHGFLKTW